MTGLRLLIIFSISVIDNIFFLTCTRFFENAYGLILGLFLGHVEVILGSFLGHVGVMLGSFLVHVGAILGSFWRHVGSCWNVGMIFPQTELALRGSNGVGLDGAMIPFWAPSRFPGRKNPCHLQHKVVLTFKNTW